MIIMQLNGISKSFGVDNILTNIKLEIKDKDRVAIVGRNGAGKSTLLKIMADELTHDGGEMYKPKDLTIGYLSQHTGLQSEKTIWDEMVDVFQDLVDQEKRLRKLEQEMERRTNQADEAYTKLLHDYDREQQAFTTNGGYRYEADIKAVLTGLNFGDYDYQTPVNELSGGQKTRLQLGKLLLQKPQLLILDEPTNHLDIDTLGWLEGYLASYPGAVAIVSHDRYFLDKTVSIVYEIAYHKTRKYHGSYSKYLEQKQLNFEQEMKEFEKQQTEMKKMEEFIQKNIVRASTTKRAQSRRKQLAKMEKLDRPLGDASSASFTFRIAKRSGNDVLKMDHISFHYPDSEVDLFSGINIHVNRAERVALVGKNGIGKTTLLKMVIGQLKPTNGTIKLGTNVSVAYYDQEQLNLNPRKTILKELWDDYPTVNEKDIRTTLGNFLFSGDDVLKMVHDLSGGEKARLSLAKLMMQKANLLILDEPTNHLDIDSKEVLEAALQDFPGTIIFVSHDRYFINKITDTVIEVEETGTTTYLGDYDYYVTKKAEEAERALLHQTNDVVEKVNKGKLSYKEEKQLKSKQRKMRREIEGIENKIEALEEQLASLEHEMTLPHVFGDHEKALALTKETDTIKEEMDKLMDEWTELQESVIDG